MTHRIILYVELKYIFKRVVYAKYTENKMLGEYTILITEARIRFANFYLYKGSGLVLDYV